MCLPKTNALVDPICVEMMRPREGRGRVRSVAPALEPVNEGWSGSIAALWARIVCVVVRGVLVGRVVVDVVLRPFVFFVPARHLFDHHADGANEEGEEEDLLDELHCPTSLQHCEADS